MIAKTRIPLLEPLTARSMSARQKSEQEALSDSGPGESAGAEWRERV